MRFSYWKTCLTSIFVTATLGLYACNSSDAPTAKVISLATPTATSSPVATISVPAKVMPKSIEQRTLQSSRLIEPTSKTQRQEELNLRVNGNTNLGRDPFATIPGSVPIPRFTPPPPIAIPRPVIAPIRRPVRSETRPYTPPAPRPEDSIVVSGAIKIAGSRYAIVSVPGEVTRYVREGDRIGGKVLVKRIEMSGISPRVVLQRNGVEFVRTIQ